MFVSGKHSFRAIFFSKAEEYHLWGNILFDEICFSPAKIICFGGILVSVKNCILSRSRCRRKKWNISYHQPTSILPGKVFKIDTLWTKNKYYQFKKPSKHLLFCGEKKHVALPSKPMVQGTCQACPKSRYHPSWCKATIWRFFKKANTVVWFVRNPARTPVEVGTLSHYLQGFCQIPGGCLGFLNHQQYGHVSGPGTHHPHHLQCDHGHHCRQQL